MQGLAEMRALVLLRLHHLPVPRGHRLHEHQHDEEDAYAEEACHQRHVPFDEEHDGNETEERHDIHHRGEETVLHEIADVGDLVDVREGTPGRRALEVLHRQLQQPFGDVQMEASLDARHHHLREDLPREGEHHLEHEEQKDYSHDHVERVQGLVDQHPVHHDSHDECRRDREHGADERRQQNAVKELALPHQLPGQPTEVERHILGFGGVAALDEDHLALPYLREVQFIDGEHHIVQRRRIPDHGDGALLGIRTGLFENQRAAVVGAQYGRQCTADLRQIPEVHVHRTRLEADLAREGN